MKRQVFRATVLALIAITIALVAPAGDLAAQSSKALAPAEAKKAMADGRALVKSGKHAAGIQKLSAAIESKKLRYRDIAQALYWRGEGYRNTGKSAKAIEDLTAALWIKNGLGPEDRKAALAARASIYQSAGLSGQGQTNPAPLVIKKPAKQATAPPPAKRPTAAPNTNGAAGASWAPQVVQAAPAQSANPLANVGSNIQSFFGGLFGGAAGGSANVPANVGSINKPAQPAPAAAAKPAAPDPAVSGWSSSDGMAPRNLGAIGARPAAGLRMQVASLADVTRAEAVARHVNVAYRDALQGRRALVSTYIAGQLGQRYRVELGPFRSPDSADALCATLRRDGLDCTPIQ